MPNQVTQAQANDDRVTHWLHIDDFSPGIWDASYIANADPVIPAPLGAASPNGTWKCASLPSGGLGPLPGVDLSADSPGFPGSATTQYVVGVAVNQSLANGNDELIIILESDDGTTHYVQGWSTQPQTSSTANILNSTSATTPTIFGAPYPAWTQVSSQPVIGNPGYVVPTTTLVFPSAVITDSHTNWGHLYLYPNPSSPSSFAVADIVVPGVSAVTGQVLTYGSRIIVLSGIGDPWPTGGIATNNQVNYTDPFGSYDYGNQNALFNIEQPWGYGAWGSVSVGELILIRKYGGGVVINGDISSPNSVISLPGIEPTGKIVGSAHASSIGLIYCAEGKGAWTWNGGNTSQKISTQIQDNFFDAATPANIPSNNYGFFVEKWQNWLLFSNNWMFNPDTGGWWIFHPTTGNGNANVDGLTFFWWHRGNRAFQFYASPLAIENDSALDQSWYVRFNGETPSKHYLWTSLPMHVVPNANRVVDVTQVILRLSSPDGTGGTVSCTIGTETETTTQIYNFVYPYRLNFGSGSLGQTDIICSLSADNPNGSAPIVHSIDIGFTARARNPADNS